MFWCEKKYVSSVTQKASYIHFIDIYKDYDHSIFLWYQSLSFENHLKQNVIRTTLKKLHSTRSTGEKLCSLRHPPLMPSAKFKHFHTPGTAHTPIIIFPYTQATLALAMSYDAWEDNNSTPQYHLMPHRMLSVSS